MTLRAVQIAGCWLLVSAGLWGGPKDRVKAPPRPPAAVRRPPAPKGGPRVNNPGASVAQRLMQMTPEERARALEKLPEAQQQQIRQRLARIDTLPEQQRRRMIQQYQAFSSLPPEKQRLVTRQIQAINQLPEDRGPVVRAELQRLRSMPEDEREARLASEEFKTRFTPAEQQILVDISANMPLPPR